MFFNAAYICALLNLLLKGSGTALKKGFFFIRAMFVLLALVSQLSCSRFTNDKKTDAEAAGGSGPKVKLNSLSCLNQVSDNFNLYFKSQGAENRVEQSWQCLSVALTEFMNNTRGQSDGVYNQEELRGFFERYLIKKEISTDLMNQVMRLKQVLLGGDAKLVTKSEILKAQELMKLVATEMNLLFDHLPILFLRENQFLADQKDENFDFLFVNRIDGAFLQLEKSGLKMLEAIQLSRFHYTLTHSKVLIDEVEKFFASPLLSQELKQIKVYLPLLERVKNILVGYSLDVRGPNELNKVWSLGVRFLKLVGIYHFRLSREPLLSSQSFFLQQNFFNEFFSIFEESLEVKASHHISFREVDELIDELVREGKQFKIEPHTIKKSLRMLVMRFLQDDPKQRGLEFRLDHLYRLKRLVQVYLLHLRAWQDIGHKWQVEVDKSPFPTVYLTGPWGAQFFPNKAPILESALSHHAPTPAQSPLFSFTHLMPKASTEREIKGIPLSYLQKELRRYPLQKILNDDHILFTDDGDFYQGHFTFLQKIMASKEAHHFSLEDQVVISGQYLVPHPDEVLITDRSFSFLSLISIFTKVLFNSYGEAGNLTRKQLTEAYADFYQLGVELGAMDPRSVDSAGRAFREADLFTLSADGNELISEMEFFEQMTILWSGGMVTVNKLINEAIEAGCSTGKLDVFKKPILRQECFLRVFRSEAPQYFSNLPGLVDYLRTLTSRGWGFYGAELVLMSKSCPEDVHHIDSSDLRTLVVVLHYIESLYKVYDTDKNGLLDLAETRRAFERFKLFMIQATKDRVKKDHPKFYEHVPSWVSWEGLARRVFESMVFKGRTPSGLDILGSYLKEGGAVVMDFSDRFWQENAAWFDWDFDVFKGLSPEELMGYMFKPGEDQDKAELIKNLHPDSSDSTSGLLNPMLAQGEMNELKEEASKHLPPSDWDNLNPYAVRTGDVESLGFTGQKGAFLDSLLPVDKRAIGANIKDQDQVVDNGKGRAEGAELVPSDEEPGGSGDLLEGADRMKILAVFAAMKKELSKQGSKCMHPAQ